MNAFYGIFQATYTYIIIHINMLELRCMSGTIIE